MSERMARVTFNRAGRWHVRFAAPQPSVVRQATGRQVGLNVGVAATLTLSDGQRPHVLRPLRSATIAINGAAQTFPPAIPPTNKPSSTPSPAATNPRTNEMS